MIKIVYKHLAFVNPPEGPLDPAKSAPFRAYLDFGQGPIDCIFEGFFDRMGHYFERITCQDCRKFTERWVVLADREAA